jgi:acetoin utilization protein AcuB
MKDSEPTVGDFMTTEPATADEGLRLPDAQQRMFINNIRHLVVHREGRMTGILSTRDAALALSLHKGAADKLTVRDAMSPELYTCTPETPISEVAMQMETHRYGCAVVVDDDVLIGVFTTTDALRALRQVASGQPAEPVVMPTHHEDHSAEPRAFVKLRHHRPIEDRSLWPTGLHFRGA